MKKIIIIILIVLFVAGTSFAGVFYWKNLRGASTVFKDAPQDITEIINTTGMPLELPEGFDIEIFAQDLDGARVMAIDALGNFWVSRTSEGVITRLSIEDGVVTEQHDIFRDLKKPHGLAIDPRNPLTLYIAEEHRILKAHLYTEGAVESIMELPSGDGHFTRTIAFGPDDRLYVSIGSSCNVCDEEDERRSKIYSMKRDGSDLREVARGLRNAVFFDWSYVDGRMWATEMGRDFLGDDLPPDEINIITEGGNYGWPTCYGKNIHDTDFDKKTYVRAPCSEPFEIPSFIDIPAHSAPLGLAFAPEEGWAEEYWYDLFVAYHGSWNRTEPAGYKIVRHKLDEFGNYSGAEDFISGWLTSDGALGRPVDIMTQPGGIMYVTDDKAGVIYRVSNNR